MEITVLEICNANLNKPLQRATCQRGTRTQRFWLSRCILAPEEEIVRLTQRLIELHKENWELAPYPVEDHDFEQPSSWTDGYKRIFKLFETTLKK